MHGGAMHGHGAPPELSQWPSGSEHMPPLPPNLSQMLRRAETTVRGGVPAGSSSMFREVEGGAQNADAAPHVSQVPIAPPSTYCYTAPDRVLITTPSTAAGSGFCGAAGAQAHATAPGAHQTPFAGLTRSDGGGGGSGGLYSQDAALHVTAFPQPTASEPLPHAVAPPPLPQAINQPDPGGVAGGGEQGVRGSDFLPPK